MKRTKLNMLADLLDWMAGELLAYKRAALLGGVLVAVAAELREEAAR